MSKTATEMFNAEVQRLMADREGCSYQDAYHLCSVRHRVLFNEMTTELEDRGRKRLANEEAAEAQQKTILANDRGMANRRRQVQTLVQKKLDAGLDYNTAFRAVQNENPSLFGAIQDGLVEDEE